ncbi:uncharacterized protein LOC117305804 [Asterias rubens]|uniref:uncharacterized protein LOC117305804 n=1 Tax=Asterias rubens TaxID=7604 RepID=UPI0014552B43|nr:uncharacterized protein LOC117305804 [Asterias rubens]
MAHNGRARGPYKRYLQDDTKEVPSRSCSRFKRYKKSRAPHTQRIVNAEREVDTSLHDHASETVINNRSATECLPTTSSEIRHPALVLSACPVPERVHSNIYSSDNGDDQSEPNHSGSEDGDDRPQAHHSDSEDGDDRPEAHDMQGAHEKVSAGSALTKFQLLILLLSFVIRHHLSDSGLGDLLKILNLIQLDCVPKTKYRFYANFKTTKETVEMHFYCDDCLAYIGMDPLVSHCPDCKCPFSKRDSKCRGNFFLYLPIAQQLKELFENPGLANLIRTPVNNGNIRDISDGLSYQKLKANGAFNDRHSISLMWNSDGVPLFKSSNYSLNPIQCIINEVPPKERSKNTKAWRKEEKEFDWPARVFTKSSLITGFLVARLSHSENQALI